MRILVVAFEFPPQIGGLETLGYQLCRHLSQAGAQIAVLSGTQPGANDFDTAQEFTIWREPLGDTGLAWQRVAQKLRLRARLAQCVHEWSPDGILCTAWDPAGYLAAGMESEKARPVPYYLIAAGMELLQLPIFMPSRWAKKKLRARALQRARKVFAISGYTREKVIELGVQADRIKVIPCGVDAGLPTEKIDPVRIDPDRKILLTISRLVPRKGHDTVLRALPWVIQKYPNLQYIIAGTGPERAKLEQLTRELGLESVVSLRGQVSEETKAELLARSDVFVLPCRETPTDFEGFGIALLEAMQFGRPVIAGRSGGIPDVVQDGVTGILVNPDEPETLAQAIIELFAQPERAQQLGEQARRAVQQRFRWDVIAQTYLKEMQS